MWDPLAVACAWDDRREKHWSSGRCGGIFHISRNLLLRIFWMVMIGGSRQAFRSVNHPPVLPIWRKNEAPAALQFPLSAGRSRSRLKHKCLQCTDIYSARLFSGSLIVFTDALQLSGDLFYETEWDVGWSVLLVQFFQLQLNYGLFNFIL